MSVRGVIWSLGTLTRGVRASSRRAPGTFLEFHPRWTVSGADELRNMATVAAHTVPQEETMDLIKRRARVIECSSASSAVSKHPSLDQQPGEQPAHPRRGWSPIVIIHPSARIGWVLVQAGSRRNDFDEHERRDGLRRASARGDRRQRGDYIGRTFTSPTFAFATDGVEQRRTTRRRVRVRPPCLLRPDWRRSTAANHSTLIVPSYRPQA